LLDVKLSGWRTITTSVTLEELTIFILTRVLGVKNLYYTSDTWYYMAGEKKCVYCVLFEQKGDDICAAAVYMT
jgi:hypothetical protein